MILVIDNYDSFVYNLVQRLGEIDSATDIAVFRNDAISLEQIAHQQPSHIIISPGPCTPNEAGVSNAIIERFATTIPILGVCLGHQCIGQVFGGTIIRNPQVMHGKTSWIHHDGSGVFAGLTNPLEATRYHSLVIDRATFHHPDFAINAWTTNNEIMGVRHRRWPLHGVQFHPESFLTTEGTRLLANFVSLKPGRPNNGQ